jgi:adenosylhomocysteine nucleosidase
MGKHIAIIGAIKDEIAGIKNQMRIDDAIRWQTGNAFIGEWQGRPIVLVRSGMGCSSAKDALVGILGKYDLEYVISIGYAGALDPVLEVGELVVADKVVHYGSQKSYSLNEELISAMPEARRGTLLTVDEVVATPPEKEALREKYSAVAVDMETSALAEEAEAYHLPFASVRAITDTASQELIDCSHLVAEDGDVSKLKAGWHILTHPGDLKGMIDLGKHAKISTANLTVFLKRYLDIKGK